MCVDTNTFPSGRQTISSLAFVMVSNQISAAYKCSILSAVLSPRAAPLGIVCSALLYPALIFLNQSDGIVFRVSHAMIYTVDLRLLFSVNGTSRVFPLLNSIRMKRSKFLADCQLRLNLYHFRFTFQVFVLHLGNK